MNHKTSLFIFLVSIGLFSCCQKDSATNSGTTNQDESYIQFMEQRFPLTDGEFFDGELSLYDETETHNYEINVELWDESPVLSDGNYTLTSNRSDMGMEEVVFELTENDTAILDSSHVWLGEFELVSASMKISSTDNIYTISITGLTAGGQEVRARYVGRIYFADKKKLKKPRRYPPPTRISSIPTRKAPPDGRSLSRRDASKLKTSSQRPRAFTP